MHPFITEQIIIDRHARASADADHSRLVRAALAGRPPAARSAVSAKWRCPFLVGTLALVAALVLLVGGSAESRPVLPSHRGAEPVTLVGLRPAATEAVSYEPGASRTWEPGPTIVGVRVVSGRLTAYGSDGQRRVYAAGDGYAAGWEAYRTANETDQRVETLVTGHVRP